MEKFSRATQEFFKSAGVIHQPESKGLDQFDSSPKTVEIYGLVKTASQIKEDINPLELRDILLKEYNTEWLDWVPENLDHYLLRGQKSDIISNKAQALRVCLGTDTPWREWHIFENVGKAFNHQVPNFYMLQPLSLGECETTLRTMRDLRSDEEFTDEIYLYVASVAFTEHYTYLPSEWEIGKAQPHLDQMVFDRELKIRAMDAWERVKSKKLLEVKFKDNDAVHQQLAKLALVQQYIREHNGSYDRSTSE